MKTKTLTNLLTHRTFSAASTTHGRGSTAKSNFSWDATAGGKQYDPSQIAQMQDMMTKVDENDRVLGPISKLDGHLLQHERTEKRSELHRAFSLLLFNSKNELLLQQRAFKKITFPGRWTNTCCSHNSHIPLELEPEP